MITREQAIGFLRREHVIVPSTDEHILESLYDFDETLAFAQLAYAKGFEDARERCAEYLSNRALEIRQLRSVSPNQHGQITALERGAISIRALPIEQEEVK